jgi:hypothetical protein
MTKKTIAIFISLLVAVMPFLGFPESFDKYFYLVSGVALAALIELVSIHYCATCDALANEEEQVLDVYTDPERNPAEEKSGSVYYEEVVEEVVYRADDEDDMPVEPKKKG